MNKLEKFAQMDTYPNVFQAPDFLKLQEAPFYMRGKWGKEYFKNDNPIVLELGCGKGEYTVGLAKLYPHLNFIGIDIKGARMHTGATQALELGLSNAAFLRTHIEFLDRIFAPDEVSEVWITFPDPQMHKPRKRLIGTFMLTRYREFLKAGGLVHLKTDSQFLYEYTSAMLKENAIEPQVTTADLYAKDSPIDANDPLLTIQTYYEQKWIGHGLSIKYFRFQCPGKEHSFVEPDIDIELDNYHSVGRGVQLVHRN